MKLRSRRRALLLLLLPAIATAAAVPNDAKDGIAKSRTYGDPIADAASNNKKYGTKDAPVDGKDGKPHAGPFVENTGKGADPDKFPTLKDRPHNPTIVDGKKIPESNDGVMDDKNRPEPKEGTTGTGGGVSAKDKERKKKESQTGEKVENRPQTPKLVPPLPHTDQEKASREKDGVKKEAVKPVGKPSEDASGLGVSPHHSRALPVLKANHIAEARGTP